MTRIRLPASYTANLLVFLLPSSLFIGCQDLSIDNREFEVPSIPTLTSDGLQVSSLAEQGIDPDEIARFACAEGSCRGVKSAFDPWRVQQAIPQHAF